MLKLRIVYIFFDNFIDFFCLIIKSIVSAHIISRTLNILNKLIILVILLFFYDNINQ